MMMALMVIPLVSCGGGGGGSSSPPVGSSSTPTPPASTPTPLSSSSPSPNAATAFTCPTSDTTLDSTGARASGGVSSETRRSYRGSANKVTMPVLAVSYRTSAIANPATTIDARVASLGASKYTEFAYPATGVSTRLLHVTPSSLTQVESVLRSTPGVVAVSQSHRLAPLAVTVPYEGNDPYFVGYTGTSAPLYQTASTGGQWDMHIVQLEHALGYSQNANGSGFTNASALGSTSVKLAIIDTGEDVTHPEVAKASIARTECFITNVAGTAQSTGTFVTDGFGHGTDVTGIAVANPNNGYGFVGDGGNVSLMLYRVFPTPDDTCASPDSSAAANDPQCGADDTDIVSAIDDAVAHGANVISMSLGGNPCTAPGVDPDTLEGAAVANAIASSVIVVAASGNSGGEGVSAPACDASVIAVGATGYEDGQTNGTNNGASTGSEYVASYTQYGSVTLPNSITSWGIVAPGGDPSSTDVSSTNTDYLHWIENIWTSTPYMSSSSDENFVGNCAVSTEFGEAGNCRTLIAGTSMATPHVAGAAALVLSVSSNYSTPAKMFQLLCTTADNISDPNQGCGRLNVYRAVGTAIGDPTP
jgi:subtilisin family serine protease